MTDDKFKGIWREYHDIQDARRKKLQEVMKDYDDKIHRPSIKALQEKCEKFGHKESDYWEDNGMGWTWMKCSYCHKKLKEEYHEIK